MAGWCFDKMRYVDGRIAQKTFKLSDQSQDNIFYYSV